MRLGHVLAPSGMSREMLLGAALSAGAPTEPVRVIAERLGCTIEITQQTIEGLVATHALIEAGPGAETADTLELVHQRIDRAGVEPAVAAGAGQVYERLFAAESALHGVAPEAVHLHQLGGARYPALIVATVASLHALALDSITVGTVALGMGSVTVANHGILPIPAPATARLLHGYSVAGGPVDGELTGPTAAALLNALTDPSPAMPPMTIAATGRGAGRIGSRHPGCVTLLVGISN